MNNIQLETWRKLSDSDKNIWGDTREKISILLKYGHGNVVWIEQHIWKLLRFPDGPQHLIAIRHDIVRAVCDADKGSCWVKARLIFVNWQVEERIAQLQNPQATLAPENPETIRKPKETVKISEETLRKVLADSRVAV